jgi:hypothetical protein
MGGGFPGRVFRKHRTIEGDYEMKQVTFAIKGVANQAVVTWNGSLVPVVDMGGGNFSAAQQTAAGTFVYSIVVFGRNGDPWSATVSCPGSPSQGFSGHMSPAGNDTTGDTAFKVQ